jgi:hypothetical protein
MIPPLVYPGVHVYPDPTSGVSWGPCLPWSHLWCIQGSMFTIIPHLVYPGVHVYPDPTSGVSRGPCLPWSHLWCILGSMFTLIPPLVYPGVHVYPDPTSGVSWGPWEPNSPICFSCRIYKIDDCSSYIVLYSVLRDWFNLLYVKLMPYQFWCTRCAFRLLKSLQWCSYRKSWKSEKTKKLLKSR